MMNSNKATKFKMYYKYLKAVSNKKISKFGFFFKKKKKKSTHCRLFKPLI
jgi:hypothetical protein